MLCLIYDYAQWAVNDIKNMLSETSEWDRDCDFGFDATLAICF